MGKVVHCEECHKIYRDVEALEDLRDNDGICLVCNNPIEVEDWDRVLASYAEDDFDDVPEDVDEDDFSEESDQFDEFVEFDGAELDAGGDEDDGGLDDDDDGDGGDGGDGDELDDDQD